MKSECLGSDSDPYSLGCVALDMLLNLSVLQCLQQYNGDRCGADLTTAWVTDLCEFVYMKAQAPDLGNKKLSGRVFTFRGGEVLAV